MAVIYYGALLMTDMILSKSGTAICNPTHMWIASRHASLAAKGKARSQWQIWTGFRHCERSEAIQSIVLLSSHTVALFQIV